MDVILNVKPLGFPWETNDPFIFCAYHRDEYPKGNQTMGPSVSLEGRNLGQDFTLKDGWRMYHGTNIPGFPHHPHRGFETITINKEGIVDHSDSLGASGRFGKGDVQWMTAGKGIQHSEMFPLINKEGGNPLEIFQIWLNLPKRSKFVEPHFKMLWKDQISVYKNSNDNNKSVCIDVIAGQLNNVTGPSPTPDSWSSDPENEVAIYTIKLEEGMKWVLPKAKSKVSRCLYFYRGNKLLADGQEVSSNHSIQLVADMDCTLSALENDCYLLLLQGKSISEPVVQYGPFVMNTEEEINQAFKEYRETQFGGWPWGESDKVHPREKGRFAIHADGRKEIP